MVAFGDLRVDRAGPGYSLTFAGPGLAGATSAAFAVAAGRPAQLGVVQQPAVAYTGFPAPAFVVQAR